MAHLLLSFLGGDGGGIFQRRMRAMLRWMLLPGHPLQNAGPALEVYV